MIYFKILELIREYEGTNCMEVIPLIERKYGISYDVSYWILEELKKEGYIKNEYPQLCGLVITEKGKGVLHREECASKTNGAMCLYNEKSGKKMQRGILILNAISFLVALFALIFKVI
ncbi:hypothetical protein [Yeguia hominis]|uniref:Uncharacterized protein n=1 Tax=Yeguia hominis TaxID=2763662 RepID=A0A926DB44_9FIRM|nr:hypothetical protein [Yeguia hominis]MBC8534579.1 hypothetical protein [Yeguia hominis]